MPNITLKGIKLFPRKDNQPDFVIASGVITPDDLMAFLLDQDEHHSLYQDRKQFRIQVLKGKDGSPYMVLDTYKAASTPMAAPGPVPEIKPIDDLPF